MMKGHFKRVTDLSIRVHSICGGKFFPDCGLSLAAPGEDGLILAVSGRVPDQVGFVAVSYTLDSYLYTFETEAVRVVPDRGCSGFLVTMNLPDRIARVERRRSPRVTLNPRELVVVRSCLPDGRCFEGIALDMGARGLSFRLPGGPIPFNLGDSLSTLITLPKLGEIRPETIVRTMIVVPEGLRIGVELLRLSEEEADIVRQYVHLRQIHVNRERLVGQASTSPSTSIFVVAAKGHSGSRQFILCSDAFLGHLADPNAFSEIASVDVIDYIERD
jgi:hypothetical protein